MYATATIRTAEADAAKPKKNNLIRRSLYRYNESKAALIHKNSLLLSFKKEVLF
jgi:hypothetical protein